MLYYTVCCWYSQFLSFFLMMFRASENQESRSAKFLSKLMPPFAQDSVSPSKFFRKKS